MYEWFFDHDGRARAALGEPARVAATTRSVHEFASVGADSKFCERGRRVLNPRVAIEFLFEGERSGRNHLLPTTGFIAVEHAVRPRTPRRWIRVSV